MRQSNGGGLCIPDMDLPGPSCHSLAAEWGQAAGVRSMSAMTDAGRRGQELIDRLIGRLIERLLDALTDPARRERTAAAVLLCYVALWTLYAAIAKGSQDIHNDMS